MQRLVAVAFVIAFVGLVTARAEDKADPTGTWKWTFMGQGGQSREATLKLKLEGDKLTGGMVGRNDRETPIEDATFKDGTVSFKITRERNGEKIVSKYTGKLSGDTLKGKIETDRGGQTRSRDWEAKRAKS
jgi:hypothetical protein